MQAILPTLTIIVARSKQSLESTIHRSQSAPAGSGLMNRAVSTIRFGDNLNLHTGELEDTDIVSMMDVQLADGESREKSNATIV